MPRKTNTELLLEYELEMDEDGFVWLANAIPPKYISVLEQ